MKINRRKFIAMLGGGAALGAATKFSYEAFASKVPGETLRYAMVIDVRKLMDKPELMNVIIQACHQAHNVPNDPFMKDSEKPIEHNRELKWIWKEKYHNAFVEQENEYLPEELSSHENETVLLLCNHCDNPPCVKVCPTKATWRRDTDGIVMMDWHRCIGCRYCIAGCPYGSRSFNWGDPRKLYFDKVEDSKMNRDFPTRTKGVVEKCTFCAEFLDRGEEVPRCVAACLAKGSDAMAFGNLHDGHSTVRKLLRENFSIRRKPELGTHPEVFYLV